MTVGCFSEFIRNVKKNGDFLGEFRFRQDHIDDVSKKV